MDDDEMLAMLVEYMGKGFLENIVALFKREPELARFIPDMIGQGNLGVRLGTTALVEELSGGHPDILARSVPGLLGLLKSENPTLRGDAASLLGTIGDRSASGALKGLLHDENAAVRDVARIALDEMGES